MRVRAKTNFAGVRLFSDAISTSNSRLSTRRVAEKKISFGEHGFEKDEATSIVPY